MQFKKTPLLAKLLILGLCIFALVTLVSLQKPTRTQRELGDELEQQVMYLQQEQKELQEDLAALGSDESIIKIARERLGMVGDGEIVFYDSDNNN